MISVIRATIQMATRDVLNDPGAASWVWIMDVHVERTDGSLGHSSWITETLNGCVDGLPTVIERLNKQETYA